MGLKLRRRSVYVATIAAILVMVAGFALAGFISIITTGGQNGFSATSATGTSYATGTPSVNLVWTTASGTCGTPTVTANDADVYITGEVACQTLSPDWFEELSFPGTSLVANPVDNFAVTVGTNAPVLFTVSLTTTVTHAITTNVFYEVGTSATATTSNVGITGD
ncbi:MAG: hypothetical protein WA688_01050 [Thermoplasmata archaeon]